jgi:hypothetical protein
MGIAIVGAPRSTGAHRRVLLLAVVTSCCFHLKNTRDETKFRRGRSIQLAPPAGSNVRSHVLRRGQPTSATARAHRAAAFRGAGAGASPVVRQCPPARCCAPAEAASRAATPSSATICCRVPGRWRELFQRKLFARQLPPSTVRSVRRWIPKPKAGEMTTQMRTCERLSRTHSIPLDSTRFHQQRICP